MRFFLELQQQTEAARLGLLSAPIIQGCLRGRSPFRATWPSSPRPTTTCATRCRCCRPARPRCRPPRLAAQPARRVRLEEQGHDEWILDDIRACGADAEAVRYGQPGHATEVMVAYAYDLIARRNPLGFFGMVHVLEGTSVNLASLAADRIQQPLRTADSAFSLPPFAWRAGQAAHGRLRIVDGPHRRPAGPGGHHPCGPCLLPALRRRVPRPAAAAGCRLRVRARWPHEGGRNASCSPAPRAASARRPRPSCSPPARA